MSQQPQEKARMIYAQETASKADPLTIEEIVQLSSGVDITMNILACTAKGGRIYSRHPQLVANINRTGKRFQSALAAVIEQATRHTELSGR
jgi:hypothetical protein